VAIGGSANKFTATELPDKNASVCDFYAGLGYHLLCFACVETLCD
jgi:hypothetical protein